MLERLLKYLGVEVSTIRVDKPADELSDLELRLLLTGETHGYPSSKGSLEEERPSE